MSQSIQDQIVAYIAGKGSDGATSADLARAFLAPASAPDALCETLIKTALSQEARVMETSEGRWVMAAGPGGFPGPGGVASLEGEFVVVETVEVAAETGRLAVEWAAVRIDSAGRIGAGGEGVIRPSRRPHGAVIPQHLKETLSSGAPMAEAVGQAADLGQGGATVVSVRPGPFQSQVVKTLQARGESAAQIFIGRLARQIISRDIKSIDDLAARFGVPVREPETASERAAFVAELLCAMLTRREEFNLGDPDEWAARQEPKRVDIDFSPYEFDRAFLESLPETPGIYLMRDANGAVAYVGKAVNLKRRVGDYFRARVRQDEKTRRILETIYSLEVEETGNELGALLAEYAGIQEHGPSINAQVDVHARDAGQRAPSRRWVAVLPSVIEEEVEVFLFHGNRTLRRALVARDDPDSLRPALEALFFSSTPPAPAAEAELGWLRIAWSWLEQHRDAANTFDVELAGGLDETLRLLAAYMAEEPGAGRVFHV